MYKKLISLLLATVMAFGISACSNANKEECMKPLEAIIEGLEDNNGRKYASAVPEFYQLRELECSGAEDGTTLDDYLDIKWVRECSGYHDKLAELYGDDFELEIKIDRAVEEKSTLDDSNRTWQNDWESRISDGDNVTWDKPEFTSAVRVYYTLTATGSRGSKTIKGQTLLLKIDGEYTTLFPYMVINNNSAGQSLV